MRKRQNISLNALRAFEAAGRLGRMSLAADELAVTHGAVSRQVGALEAALGVQLMEGSRRQPKLTRAGMDLLPVLTRAFDDIDTALARVVQSEATTLDVACLSTFAIRWLVPRLHGFKALHPDVDIRLSTDENRIAGTSRQFDLAITIIGQDARSGSQDVDLFEERLGLVHAPLSQEARGAASLPRLSTRTRPHAWQEWSAASGISLDDDRAAVEYEHYYFTVEAALNGLGACIAPLHLVEDAVHAGRLIAPHGFVKSGYRYVARLRQGASPKAVAFCTWLKDEASG